LNRLRLVAAEVRDGIPGIGEGTGIVARLRSTYGGIQRGDEISLDALVPPQPLLVTGRDQHGRRERKLLLPLHDQITQGLALKIRPGEFAADTQGDVDVIGE
jgi:hypothetical protein